MSDLNELYQEIILDHNKRPRNYRKLAAASKAEGHNPMCGDRVTVYVKEKDGRIEDVAFEGLGCAISTASASIMTERLKGRTVAEADTLFRRFQDMVTGKLLPGDRDGSGLDALEAFQHLSDYPMRVKCATLPWHTMKAALGDRDGAESSR